jgi:hypothetical protein
MACEAQAIVIDVGGSRWEDGQALLAGRESAPATRVVGYEVGKAGSDQLAMTEEYSTRLNCSINLDFSKIKILSSFE